MNYKSEKIIIVGGSGSGKDFLIRGLEREGILPSIKVTNRPKRSNEKNNVDYRFKNLDEFNALLEGNKFLVNQEFKNNKNEVWKYGILKKDFLKFQSFIMTPGEVLQLNDEYRKLCFIVYLDIPRSIRESRILNRQDSNDSIIRRLDSDDIDFKDFKDYDLRITDPYFDISMIIDLMN